jgi:hypothetical protein
MGDQKPEVVGQFAEIKIIENAVYPQDQLVKNETFDEPIKVSYQNISTEPTAMLYQPPFYLSEADFEKIRRPSSKLAGFGIFCIGLSASNTLRLLLKLSETGFSQASMAASLIEGITTSVILLIGVLFVVVGSHFSRTKNSIFKEIQEHFDSNKPKLEIRHTGKPK